MWEYQVLYLKHVIGVEIVVRDNGVLYVDGI